MDSFQDRIKGLRFTKTEKRIADYILENQKTVGLETAVKIAEKLDVTDMSVHRFLRKLGYSGFAEFRDEMNAQLIEHYEDSWKELSPGKKYLQTSNTIGDGDVAGLVVFQAMANIRKSMEQTDARLFVDVAECILRGRRKYVIGFRGSSSLASYMNRKLTVFLPGVHALLAADSSVIEELIDLTDRDVIILYSFPRYSTLNESCMRTMSSPSKSKARATPILMWLPCACRRSSSCCSAGKSAKRIKNASKSSMSTSTGTDCTENGINITKSLGIFPVCRKVEENLAFPGWMWYLSNHIQIAKSVEGKE